MEEIKYSKDLEEQKNNYGYESRRLLIRPTF